MTSYVPLTYLDIEVVPLQIAQIKPLIQMLI